MNQHTSRSTRPTTQAAEGVPRWRWTLADLDRFTELGILDGDDKVELIGGELVPMAAKGVAHETIRTDLADWLLGSVSRALRVEQELGWRPDDSTYCEPDIVVFPRKCRPVSTVPPAEVLLLVEVSDTTVKKDTSIKAGLYARLGVREYWVVDAHTRATTVHLEPSANGYRRKHKVPPNRALKPTLLNGLALRLADLPIAHE